MEAEVLGVDHIYLSVRSLAASELFYEAVFVRVLGFRAMHFELHGAPHVQYYNRQLGIVIRPAKAGAGPHDSAASGLHHLCLRVLGDAEVDRVASALRAHGIAASAPRLYPEYAPDYYATFFEDPDGIRLEVMNFRAARRQRMEHWEAEPGAAG
jgi:catechol 2,3-dioxygenase-like lactoylglutathione lyase family enzyme